MIEKKIILGLMGFSFIGGGYVMVKGGKKDVF